MLQEQKERVPPVHLLNLLYAIMGGQQVKTLYTS